MYVFYQHHRDGAQQVVLTELKLSSRPDIWHIQWKVQVEVACFELVKPILKFPPVAKRSYDEATKVWTYFDDYGVQVLQKIEQILSTVKIPTLIEVEDLQFLATRERFDYEKTRRREIRPEDFFYQQAAPTAPKTIDIAGELAALLEISRESLPAPKALELKKLYRHAALKYHPDRNNGDGSKMSELNMLWGLYNG